MYEPTAVVEYQHITEHEVESAVKRSKSGKAPWCDIIPNEVYKAGEHEMVRRLTAIFNQAYIEGCVPTECPIYQFLNVGCDTSLKKDSDHGNMYLGKELEQHMILVIEKHCEYNQPLFIAFLDLEKAFDRVPREKLWMAMAEYMVPADLQIATKSTYQTNKNRVSTNIGSGEWFTTESGVRQGSTLSPILFVMYMDLVIKEVHPRK